MRLLLPLLFVAFTTLIGATPIAPEAPTVRTVIHDVAAAVTFEKADLANVGIHRVKATLEKTFGVRYKGHLPGEDKFLVALLTDFPDVGEVRENVLKQLPKAKVEAVTSSEYNDLARKLIK